MYNLLLQFKLGIILSAIGLHMIVDSDPKNRGTLRRSCRRMERKRRSWMRRGR